MAATSLGGAAPATGAPGVQLELRGVSPDRAVVCGGPVRDIAVAQLAGSVVARVTAPRGSKPTLTIERCRDGRFRDLTRRRLVRRARGYSARIDTTRAGEYRIRARVRGRRSRAAYLRVEGEPVRVRKDVKNLTAEERLEYVDAVLALKSTPSPYDAGLSYYDQFVAWHQVLSRCDPSDPLLTDMQRGHLGPMFLPWHRLFVLLFERALREVSGEDIAVPYWDWTDPRSTEAVFADDFMGGDGDPDDGYAVKTGPFRKGQWQLNVHPVGLQWASSATPSITRHFGSFPGVPLPTPEDVRSALRVPLYDVPPFSQESDPDRSFRNAIEGFRPPLSGAIVCGPDGVIVELGRPPQELHNAPHIWVGGRIFPEAGEFKVIGTMFNPTSSPNDPVFFLHHSMIDRIWAEWQERHGVDTYLPRSGFPKNNIDDVMNPFDEAAINFTPEDVADIRRLGYRYDSGRSGRSRPKTRLPLGARPLPLQPEVRFHCGLVR